MPAKSLKTSESHTLELAAHAHAQQMATRVVASRSTDVEDCRESSALEIIDLLQRRGADVAFADPYVGELRLPGSEPLAAVASPEQSRWDLVIVHTVHPGCDPSWLSGQNAVLDTTYRLSPELRCAHL